MLMHKSIVAFTGFLALSCLTNCSRPAIKTTSIDGRLAGFTNFRIEWDGINAVDTLYRLEGEDVDQYRSRYTVADHCLDYVDEVGEILAVKHGLKFYDNMPVEAVIRVKLYGIKINSFGFPRLEAEKRNDELREQRSMIDSPFAEDYPYRNLSATWGKDDLVHFVQVFIFDHTGRPMGEILIGGDPADDVSAKRTASAIADARLGR